jgi:hypothetical protein
MLLNSFDDVNCNLNDIPNTNNAMWHINDDKKELKGNVPINNTYII